MLFNALQACTLHAKSQITTIHDYAEKAMSYVIIFAVGMLIAFLLNLLQSPPCTDERDHAPNRLEEDTHMKDKRDKLYMKKDRPHTYPKTYKLGNNSRYAQGKAFFYSDQQNNYQAEPVDYANENVKLTAHINAVESQLSDLKRRYNAQNSLLELKIAVEAERNCMAKELSNWKGMVSVRYT